MDLLSVIAQGSLFRLELGLVVALVLTVGMGVAGCTVASSCGRACSFSPMRRWR